MTQAPRATYMLFINCPAEDRHFDQLPLAEEVAGSMQLVMEWLSSWAVDTRRFQSCLVTPNVDEEGDICFQLDCVDGAGQALTLIAAVFKCTTIN